MRDRTWAIEAEREPVSPARRLVLKSTVGLAVAVMTPQPAWARRLSGKASGRELSLLNLHTGERIKAEYWHNGQYVPSALRAVSVVLRDYHNNKIHPIDPMLLDLIHLLHAKLRSNAPFNVVSGYRSPETNALMHEASSGVAAHSLHMEGRAIDIRLPGVRLASVKRMALDMHLGGVGYYPADDFVHVDTGAVRRWGA